MELPELMTIAEVGDLLRISRAGVYNLIDAGEISRIRLSPKAVRIPSNSVRAYLARHTDEQVPA